MFRRCCLITVWLLACWTPGSESIEKLYQARAEGLTGLVIPRQQALAHGMRRSWVTRIRLDRARDRVQSVLIGPERIFVLSERGTLHAIDAATGNTVWAARTGNRNYPSLGPAASDTHVAVVNGSTLYAFRRSDGRPLWEESLTAVPSAGPAAGTDMVYVPMFNGVIEAYEFEVPTETLEERLLGRVPVMYSATGRAESPPLLTPNSVAWGTSSGYVYAGPADSLEARFQYLTRGAVRAPLAYHKPAVIAASLDGYLYAIDELTGQALWTFAAGSTLSQAPSVIGDAVYLVPDRGGMFRLSADSGLEQWRTTRATRFLAASPSRVYAADALGRVLVLSAESGRLVDLLHTERLTWKPTNTATDRLYLGTRDGLLQCLHERELSEPLVYGTEAEAKEVAQDEPAEPGEGAEPREAEMQPDGAVPEEGDDPFANP